jgi:hypothetical protein
MMRGATAPQHDFAAGSEVGGGSTQVLSSLFFLVVSVFVKEMRRSDDQYRLNARQRQQIDQIGQQFHFNLARPASSFDEITTCLKFHSLTDFIEEFDWKYADLDIIDRLQINHLYPESFCHYIDKSDTPLEEPGHLSPVTVAKVIEYGVNLLGSFIEAYVGANHVVGKGTDFSNFSQAVLESARGGFATCSLRELNWYAHFELLMRHPVVNAGVQFAAWHHYRLPEDLLSA